MIEQASEIPGAKALLEHIRENYSSVPAFADAHGLQRMKVQRAITSLQRIDVEFAVAIEAATKGEVKTEWWWRGADVSEPVEAEEDSFTTVVYGSQRARSKPPKGAE